MDIAKEVRTNRLKAAMASSDLLLANRMPKKARPLFSAWERRAWAFFGTSPTAIAKDVRTIRLSAATHIHNLLQANRMPKWLDRSFPPGSVEPGHFLLRPQR